MEVLGVHVRPPVSLDTVHNSVEGLQVRRVDVTPLVLAVEDPVFGLG